MPDTTAPIITAFVLPATSLDFIVPVTLFTATDNVAVTGYLITTSGTPPSVDDPGWSGTPQATVTAVEGANTFCAWAKDAAGNISDFAIQWVTVTVVSGGGGGGGINNSQAIIPPLDAATIDFPQAVIDAIAEAVAARLLTDHGAGQWGTSVLLPVMSGQAYTATAKQQKEVTIVQGDTPTITLALGNDYTGWTARFAVKHSAYDAYYALPVRDAYWLNAAQGLGAVDLSATDTAVAGKFLAEVELTKGALVLTALRFTLIIIPDIVKAG